MITSQLQGPINQSKSVLIIGFGSRGSLYAKCIAQREGFSLEGVVKNHHEPDLTQFPQRPKIYKNLGTALKEREWDVAVVSVPHYLHDSITRALIESNVRTIIKEKPLATSSLNAQTYVEMLKKGNVTIYTTTQRMIQPSFLKGLKLIDRIGKITNFDYAFHFALAGMTSGWRAQKESAVGGVVLDMGYHAVEVLHLFFGNINEVSGRLSFTYVKMREQNLEDKAEIQLSFGSVKGTLSLDRHAQNKIEVFKIEGCNGSLEITPNQLIIYDRESNVEKYDFPIQSKEEQINLLFDRFLKDDFIEWRQKAFSRNLDTVATIQKVYENSVKI